MSIKNIINREHDIDYILMSSRKIRKTIESCRTIDQIDNAANMVGECYKNIYYKEHFWEYSKFVLFVARLTNKKKYEYHKVVIAKTMDLFAILLLIANRKRNEFLKNEEN